MSRLEKLLGEDRSAALQRATLTFDQAAAPCGGRIVIYGAGGLGQRLLRGLRAQGVEPLAFADRNPAAWLTSPEGLAVLSPDEAVHRFGRDAVFVVAVWNPVATGGVSAIAAHLTAMGCRRVVPFTWLFWKYDREFLPYYLWDLPGRVIEAADNVRAAYAMLLGSRSQAEFLRQLEFRLTGDFGCLKAPDGDPQYFPARLFRPREDECFVDCGAYDGDTLRAMAEWTGGRFQKAVAFEADPWSFGALQQMVERDETLRHRVRIVQQAVGREAGTLRFAASGLSSAAISEAGDIEVQCVPLDEALTGEHPTYIKMDIEGAEMDALAGASAVLRRDRPALAICAYHVQDHLWRIPLLIHEMLPESRLLLRPYCANGWELVCYAIPADRPLDLSLEDGE